MTCEERASYFEYVKGKVQIFVISLTIFALLLTIYIISQSNYYFRNNIIPSAKESAKIFRLSKIVTAILVIVSLYYFLQAYEDYQMNPQKAQFWFFVASILVLTAVLIRYYWVRQSSGADVEGAEDIV